MLAGEIRRGTTYEKDGIVYVVTDFQHVKQGRMAAFIRAKVKNAETGQVKEVKFSSTDKIDKAQIDKNEMQYLYKDGGLYYFMDMETYEQIPVDEETVGETLKFIKENDTVFIYSYKGKVINVDPQIHVELLITESEPGIQGDTSKAGTKPATLETGLVVRVPLFVTQGEVIKIDTRTSEYVERVKK